MGRAPRIAHVTTVDLTLRFLLFGQLKRLRQEGFDVTGISAPGPWVADLEAAGIRHVPWPHATRSWSPKDDALAFAELVTILRRGRFDLVHTHNPKPGVLGRIAARAAGIPCVVNTVHGLYAVPEDRPARKLPVLAMEWLAAAFSDLELFQSGEDLAWARRLRLVGERQGVLLGNGVDLTRFDPAATDPAGIRRLRAELGIPEGSLVVGAVGRLVAEKGYREFFEAARRIRAADPSVRFLAIGDLDEAKSDAISGRELEAAADDVLVTGWREDMPELLALLDVFVLPSWREGMPRSAIEAGAMGRPLVLTDIRGCREVARDGIEGILVPPRDPARLAEAITRLIEDPKLRATMGTAARARVLERFDEEHVERLILDRSRALLRHRGLPTAEPGPVRIRRARPADADAIARIHGEALPEAFLPTLGHPFLRRLYVALADDPATTLLVAVDGEGVIGFAAGVCSVGGFYRRFLVRHGVQAAVAVAPRAFRPDVWRRMRETAAYPDRAASLPQAELLSIAVDPSRRAEGIGRALALGVIGGLSDVAVPEMKVVVSEENLGANRFYAALGFRQAARIEVHEGSASNVWVIACRS
jgi:glycosyltransferase involved in cell wall biosynthesis/ribosomal protein S18 acetylase RimI-like enzyme